MPLSQTFLELNCLSSATNLPWLPSGLSQKSLFTHNLLVRYIWECHKCSRSSTDCGLWTWAGVVRWCPTFTRYFHQLQASSPSPPFCTRAIKRLFLLLSQSWRQLCVPSGPSLILPMKCALSIKVALRTLYTPPLLETAMFATLSLCNPGQGSGILGPSSHVAFSCPALGCLLWPWAPCHAPPVPSLSELCCVTPSQDVGKCAFSPAQFAKWVFPQRPPGQVCRRWECVIHWSQNNRLMWNGSILQSSLHVTLLFGRSHLVPDPWVDWMPIVSTKSSCISAL